jgi:hypothetical protein
MRYLAATDGSTVGDDAVRYAARNALAFDATLVIVHVLTPESELVDGTLVMPGEEAALDDGERVLTGAEAVAERTVAEETGDEDDAIDVETELLTGRPADAITQFATETDARRRRHLRRTPRALCRTRGGGRKRREERRRQGAYTGDDHAVTDRTASQGTPSLRAVGPSRRPVPPTGAVYRLVYPIRGDVTRVTPFATAFMSTEPVRITHANQRRSDGQTRQNGTRCGRG